ncbi:MAG: hypothetical protein ACP5NU_03445 [Methanomicrobiales archaeon]
MQDDDKIKNLLLKICANKDIFSYKKFNETSFRRISFKGDIFFTKDENDKFLQILEILFKEKFYRDNFKTEYLKDLILEIIIGSNQVETENLISYLEDKLPAFYNKINSEIKEYLFIFPVENLHLQRQFKVGGVTFYPYSKTYKRKIRGEIWNIIKNNPHF